MSTILTLHCSAGAGHRSVARAIDEAIANRCWQGEAIANRCWEDETAVKRRRQGEAPALHGQTGTAAKQSREGDGNRKPPASALLPEAARADANQLAKTFPYRDAADPAPLHLVADSLCFSGPPFRAMCSRGYEFFARHIRWACGVGYVLLDKPSSRSPLVRFVQKTSNMAVEGLAGFLAENDVDTVCCTHFMPMSLVGDLRRSGRYHGALHVCVTDYDIQGLWFEPEVDRYYVATDKGARRLTAWGISPDRITVTGIPVRHDFAALPDAATGGEKDAEPDRPLRVLFSAGSLKTREALRLLRELANTGLPLDIAVVTGRTPSLRKTLAAYTPPGHVRVDVHGFEPHLERFMAQADVMVTKPGGITCTESLCAGLPMLFVFPIPMQEVHNARILEQAGAGIACFAQGSLGKAIRKLNADRERLAAMRHTCRRLARPEAASVIGAALLGDIAAPPLDQRRPRASLAASSMGENA